eukprot:GHUV01010341.1.p1 GENE.GHUV01010341.1~~GHUV01010341.1.p1  ORF type:complete len:193 (+),score=39.75 GHUV01010341.1:244-822(+)
MDAQLIRSGGGQHAHCFRGRKGAHKTSVATAMNARTIGQPTRPSRSTSVVCQSAVQLEIPKTATMPRQMPATSIALVPVVQEATVSYDKPLRGSPTPLGATYNKEAGAINFAIASQGAEAVKLVLFTEDDLALGKSTYEIELCPINNKTGDVWHIALPGCDNSLLYGYRVLGPNQEDDKSAGAVGHKFDEVT